MTPPLVFASPPEAHSLPSSPYRLVLWLSCHVAPSATSLLVPPVLVRIGVLAAGPMKLVTSVPLPRLYTFTRA
ncbi:Uncharacterised protein [Xylophilus ampelinus]|nr:Uncharacterised protein [Xylophilus ampelinus]